MVDMQDPAALAHPTRTSIPQMASLRTTKVNVDEEHGYGVSMPSHQYFLSGRHYAQMNSSGALSIHNAC
jgi:hypothetical protein